MIRPFLVALGLLTRLPVFLARAPTAAEQGRSVLAYPLVGAVVGLSLAGLASGLTALPGALGCALLLTAWVLLTGGLHLDGLADSADAWAGGLGDRQRAMAILKDARSGPAAVVAVVLVLLLKFAALQAVLVRHEAWVLLLPPLLGRGGIVLLFLTTPYARPGGMGAAAHAALPRGPGWVWPIGLTVLLVFWPGLGVWILPGWLGCVLVLRWLMINRLGGTTGDTAGALCEIVETVALITLA